jgi:AP2-associated kinase
MYEDFEKYTTMMYRPPEMIDKFKRWNVNTKADIWMIGCVAFTMIFAEHPFKDAQKLAICSANYNFP